MTDGTVLASVTVGFERGVTDVTNFVLGNNLVNANPQSLFTSRTPIVPADFQLQPFSLAIDRGITLTEVPWNYNQTARPQDGDGLNGAEHDIGAYEYVAVPKPSTFGLTRFLLLILLSKQGRRTV